MRQVGRQLYLVVAPDSWKARHITARGQVAVTVPVRRRGLLSLVLPIPPATVSDGTEDEHLRLEQSVGLVKCSSELSLAASSVPRRGVQD